MSAAGLRIHLSRRKSNFQTEREREKEREHAPSPPVPALSFHCQEFNRNSISSTSRRTVSQNILGNNGAIWYSMGSSGAERISGVMFHMSDQNGSLSLGSSLESNEWNKSRYNRCLQIWWFYQLKLMSLRFVNNYYYCYCLTL